MQPTVCLVHFPPVLSPSSFSFPSSWCQLNTVDCFSLCLTRDGVCLFELMVDEGMETQLKDGQEVGLGF